MSDERPRPGPSTRAIRVASRVLHGVRAGIALAIGMAVIHAGRAASPAATAATR